MEDSLGDVQEEEITEAEEEVGLQVDEIVTLVRAYYTVYDQRSKKLKIKKDKWSIPTIFEIELPLLFELDRKGRVLTELKDSGMVGQFDVISEGN